MCVLVRVSVWVRAAVLTKIITAGAPKVTSLGFHSFLQLLQHQVCSHFEVLAKVLEHPWLTL